MSKEWPTDTATVTVPVAMKECGNDSITKDNEFNYYLLNLTKINNIENII